MTVATATTDSAFDAPLDRLQSLVITSPWSSDWTSAAARVLGIPELLEDILIVSAELLEEELVADEYGSYHSALSPRDMCWLFRVQTVSKKFARTIAEAPATEGNVSHLPPCSYRSAVHQKQGHHRAQSTLLSALPAVEIPR
nr:hypothetical protein B0A51_13775 [Rachicladosporium sp. CCFEE 5018]